jgi:DNA modification methylase
MQQPLEWICVKRKVEDLKAYEFNPRSLSSAQKDKLKASLVKFNLVEIPVVDNDNTLIAGHQRIYILKLLKRGKDIIDVRMPNRKLTEEEFKEYNIRSNISAGDWDTDLLKDLEIPNLEEWGMDKSILAKIATAMDEVPDLNEDTTKRAEVKPLVKVGDIFSINGHRLMCGDSTFSEMVAALMAGKKAGMVFIDPPYNVKIDSIVNLGKTQHREFKQASGEMTVKEFTEWLSKVFKNLVEHSVDGSIHYVCMDYKHQQEVLTAGIGSIDDPSQGAYSELKQFIVWVKDNAGMGTFYRSKHELIFVFKNGTAPHINNFELGQHGRYRTNVWEYPGANSFSSTNDGDNKLHPTVKPTELVRDAILDCSHPKSIILDLFGGSGTTMLAAEQSKRLAYLMEFDELYIETIIRRMAKYYASQNKKIEFAHINGELDINQIIANE